jgi:Carboxypeptidase regulatory-like domain
MYRFSTPQLPPVEGKKPARGVIFFTGLLLAALFISCFPAFAQNATGSIGGTVTDASGAVVPGAKIVLKNEGNGVTRDSVSNSAGFFNFVAVYPGSYTVTITAAGFTTWEESGLPLSQGANLSANAVLKIGTATTQVEVISAAEVPVPTDNGAASTTLNQHMITETAIQGRDAAELIKIMPGMAMSTGLSQGMWNSLVTQNNSGPIGNFSSQGTAPYGAMTMTSDGANLLDPGNQGTQTANINQNQIAEFSILTNAYGAEFAKGPMTFQAIGKSGTSQFHGGGYFYARNGVFNSEDSYLKASGLTKPQDAYYYPGGDIGGPVIIPKVNFNKNHDKLFFYAAYEYMNQQPAGSLIQRFIPTQQMMNGNFSPAYISSLGPGFANSTYAVDATPPCGPNAPDTTCRGTLPNGIIPASQINPSSLALYKTMPQPNTDPTSNATGTNYQYLNQEPVNRWELRLRGDYSITEKMKVFFSWNRQNETDINPISVWWGANNSIPYPTSMPANQVSQVYSANVTNVFTPTLTNEFIFADATFINPITMTNPAAVNPSKVGFQMTGLFTNPYTPQIPNTLSWGNGVPGYFAPTFGQSYQGGAFGKTSQAPNFADNLTKVWNTHTVKVGMYWDTARNLQANSNFSTANQGVLDFESYGANSSGNPAADFAMARVTGFSQQNSAPVADLRYHQYSWYISDQWKASRRLTLTLGLRADHLGAWYTANSSIGLAVFDPATYDNSSSAPAWTGVSWHGVNSAIPLSGSPSRMFYYEPRVGAAYDLFGTGKTVLRGGYGIYRYNISANTASGPYNPGLNVVSESTTWNCCIGYNSFNQFSPSLGPAGLGTGITVMNMGDERTPWTQSWNVTISQRAVWNSLVEVQYVGNNTQDGLLGGGTNGNLGNIDNIGLGAFYKPDPITGVINNPFAGGFPTNDYYPYHNYTAINLVSHGSYSNYNAFITSWQKQTGQVTWTANYAFSKVLGVRDGYSGNGNQAGYALNPYSAAANYGVLGWDHTHVFNFAYIVNLPKYKTSNKFISGTINGWVLSGITQVQSGAPIQPNSNQGSLNAQYGNIAAGPVSAQTYLGTNAFGGLPVALTCDPRDGKKSGTYFNTSCFAPPAFGQVGPIVWPYIHGPAFVNSDLSIFKNFNVTERQRIQVRFEAFNFLNHPLPEFNASGNNADVSLNFNQNGQLANTNQNATTTGAPLNTVGRRVIEFAIKYNF